MIRIQIENRLYERLVLEAVEYAILSLPYTINRMELKETSTRIDTCQTPFYQPDRRDFILGREEWDLKNNFLHHRGPVLPPDDYYELPGLIPDRGQWDQWSKRSDCLHQPETEAVCFLFSFMKGWQGKQPFLTVSFTPEQHAFLDEMIVRVGQESEPYDPDWFWGDAHPDSKPGHCSPVPALLFESISPAQRIHGLGNDSGSGFLKGKAVMVEGITDPGIAVAVRCDAQVILAPKAQVGYTHPCSS